MYTIQIIGSSCSGIVKLHRIGNEESYELVAPLHKALMVESLEEAISVADRIIASPNTRHGEVIRERRTESVLHQPIVPSVLLIVEHHKNAFLSVPRIVRTYTL